MPYPQHEADLERQTVYGCLQAVRHLSRLPSFARDLVSSTSAYYAARDVVDLDHQQLTEIISFTRKMVIKVMGMSLFLVLIVCLATLPTCHAAKGPPWTPEDFDWSSLQVAPKEQWRGLYLNLTAYPKPLHPSIARMVEIGQPGKIGEDDVLFLPFILGLAWQAFNVAVGIGSAVTAIQGCVTDDGSPNSVLGCAFGLAGTLLSIGSAFKAAQATGWFARANNGFGGSGLENIALDVFSKRAQDEHQQFHEKLVRYVLENFSASTGEAVEFVGYAPEDHRLSRRDDEHLHPRAPIFRFTHPKHGKMDIASRQHVNATRFTASFANRLGKRQTFQHETFTNHVFEGRFDGAAQRSDPGASFDAASGYQQIESTIDCFDGIGWEGGMVLSAQLFDNSAQETFAFASVGIFENHNADGPLQAFTPRGMPFMSPSC